jgi:formylglycine-generating enzyme required for sulfatase activity
MREPLRHHCAAILLLSLLAFTPLFPHVTHAQDNPFDKAAQASFSGRFVGPEATLRLKPEAGKWTGSLIFKGTTYTLQGENKEGKLEGTFGEEASAFTATSDGDNLSFTAGTFTAKLQRQKLPKLEGVYASKRVKLDFQNKDGGLNGTILFNGKQFQFTATESSGDLEGVFKSGDEAFKFTLINDSSGLSFQTGKFSDPVSWKPQRLQATAFGNAARWTNSLGMVFVKVPGTDAWFSIWDTRGQDYRVYAKDNEGILYNYNGVDHPVSGVTWNDAKKFCKWLTEQERGDRILTANELYRLPTDAEWSLAVGLQDEPGSTPKERNEQVKGVYPWGAQWPPPSRAGNYGDKTAQRQNGWPAIEGYDDGYVYTSPVGSFSANKYGLYDMGGNVAQWCEDFYHGQSGARVLRGSIYQESYPSYLLSSHRVDGPPDREMECWGFRCVLVQGEAK